MTTTADAICDRSLVGKVRRETEVAMIALRAKISHDLALQTVSHDETIDPEIASMFAAIDDHITDAFCNIEREIPSDDDIRADDYHARADLVRKEAKGE